MTDGGRGGDVGWIVAAVLMLGGLGYLISSMPFARRGEPTSPPATDAAGAVPVADAGEAVAPQIPDTPSGGRALVAGLSRALAFFDGRQLHGDQAFLIGAAVAPIGAAHRAWAEGLQPLPAVAADAERPADPDNPLVGLEGVFWNSRTLPHRPWPPLDKPPGLRPVKADVKMDDADIESFMALMAAVLRCGDPGADVEGLHALLSEPATGYVLTHQLLGAGWARDRGCLDGARTDALRSTLGPAVYQELLGDGLRLDDLQVERMAVLCFTGLCAWLDDTHVDALLRGQRDSGGWGVLPVEVNARLTFPEGHSAVLGLYTLAARWAENPSPLPAPSLPDAPAD